MAGQCSAFLCQGATCLKRGSTNKVFMDERPVSDRPQVCDLSKPRLLGSEERDFRPISKLNRAACHAQAQAKTGPHAWFMRPMMMGITFEITSVDAYRRKHPPPQYSIVHLLCSTICQEDISILARKVNDSLYTYIIVISSYVRDSGCG